VHQSPRLGAGLLWRSLGRSLLANFSACAAQLWLRPGAGGRSHSCASPEQHFKAKAFGAGVVRARPPHKKAEEIFKELGYLQPDTLSILKIV